MNKDIVGFLIGILFLLLPVSQASMKYPIHLGGFAGDTDLQGFSFDRSMNLVVTGISSDT